MKVKVKLTICAIVPLLLALCISFGAYFLYETMSAAENELHRAGRLVEKSLDLKRAARDMLVERDADAVRLWQARWEQMTDDIAADRVDRGPQQLLFAELDMAMRSVQMADEALPAAEEGNLLDTKPGLDLLHGTDRLVAASSMVMDFREADLGRTRRASLAWMLAMVVLLPGLLSVTAILTSRRIFHGIAALGQGTARIARGNLDYRIPVPNDDELGELAASFNKMSDDLNRSHRELADECQAHKEKAEALRVSNEQLEEALQKLQRAQMQIVQQERILALKQISSGMMRDFNEALTPIISIAEMLKSHEDVPPSPPDLKEYVSVIHDSATRALNVIKQLASFFSPHDNSPMLAVRLPEVVDKALALTRPLWKEQQEAENVRINVVRELESVDPIEGDFDSLVEMMTNLIINAVDAMPTGGELRLGTRMEKGEVLFLMQDSGVGMDEKTAQCCFEPFFTTKPEAAGMGLAVVSGTVMRHKGNVDIESEPGEGTTLTMQFPSRAPFCRVETAATTVVSEDLPKLRILVVDDDLNVSRVLGRLLRVEGHTVTTASSGSEGLQAFKEGTFDLLLTDRAMPDMNGDELARQVKEMAPDTPVLMITGFGSSMKEKGRHPEHVDKILNKPYSQNELFSAIAQLVGTAAVCP